jgi:hypothetical protein
LSTQLLVVHVVNGNRHAGSCEREMKGKFLRISRVRLAAHYIPIQKRTISHFINWLFTKKESRADCQQVVQFPLTSGVTFLLWNASDKFVLPERECQIGDCNRQNPCLSPAAPATIQSLPTPYRLRLLYSAIETRRCNRQRIYRGCLVNARQTLSTEAAGGKSTRPPGSPWTSPRTCESERRIAILMALAGGLNPTP